MSDGKRTFSSVASELGITENTVRNRINKMNEDGLFFIKGLANPDKIDWLDVMFVGISLDKHALGNIDVKLKELSALKGVVSASLVSGRYDVLLLVTVASQESHSFMSFLTAELAKVEGVMDMETFVVFKSENLLVPYIL